MTPLLKGAPAGEPAEATSIVEERERLNRVHYPQRYRDAEPVVGPGACEFSLASEDVAQSLLDLTLGVWSHLVADTVWNTRVNQYLEAHGGKPCEEFRIKKQGDFDLVWQDAGHCFDSARDRSPVYCGDAFWAVSHP